MDCQKVAEKLSAFLDGELPERQRLLVVQHLDACEACAAEHRSLAAAWQRVGELPRIEPRAHLWPRIEARLDHQNVGYRWGWFSQSPFPALVTVALIVGLFVGTQLGARVVNRGDSSTRAVGQTDDDPLSVPYFGEVFPGSLPDAVLNVGVETRTAELEGVRR